MTHGKSTISPLKNQVGLYFEEKSNLKISDSNWNLIIVRNISLLKVALEQNDLVLTKTIEAIGKNRENEHKQISSINEIFPHIINLQLLSKRVNRSLNNLFLETPQNYRNKRGLVDGLGKIIKSISGNLDADDAKKYDLLIDILQKDTSTIKEVLASQNQIITKADIKFNETITRLKVNEQELVKRIHEYMEYDHQIQKQQSYFQIQITLEKIFETYMIIEAEIETLILGVTFSKLNEFYAPLIDVNILLEEVKKIPHNLLSNNLPLKPSFETIGALIELCSLKAFITSDKLVTILQMPLVVSQTFKIYHILPFPSLKNRSTIIFPTLEYVAVSHDRMLYINANKEFLKTCKILTDVFICPSPTILEATLGPCEVQVLIHKDHPECNPLEIQIRDTIIHQLEANKWILSTPSPTTISVCCEGTCHQENVTSRFQMSLEWPCFAKIGNRKLQSSHDVVTSTTLPLELPIQTFARTKETIRNHLEPIHLVNTNMAEFEDLQNLLEEQRQKIKAIGSSTPFKPHYTSFALGTIILILLLGFSIMKIMPRIRKATARRVDHQHVPIPTPRTSGSTRPVNLRTLFEV